MNLHGKLKDKIGGELSGDYTMYFNLYNVTNGGTSLWNQSSFVSVDREGIYSVILSDIDLEFDKQYYLGVAVESDAEMTPRVNLTSTPYSFTTSGLDEEINLTHNVSIDQGTLFIDYIKDFVGIKTSTPSDTLDVGGNLTLNEKISFAFGEVIDNIVDGWITITGGLNVTESLSVTKNLTVAGDLNVDSGTLFVNSSSDRVGIGTTSPSQKLVVVGSANITGKLISDSIYDVSSQGLVLGMNFNNGSIIGNTVLDSSEYNNHGTNVGATFNASGGFNSGGAFEFDGSNDYISIIDVDELSFGNGTTDTPFSISAWVNMNDATNFYIISKGVGYVDGEYHFRVSNNDKIRFLLYNPSVSSYLSREYNTALTSYQGTWIHLVGTYSGVGGADAEDGINIYLNGVAVDDNSYKGGTYVAMENLDHDVWIGKYSTTEARGTIDDVRIYNRALSAEEIKALYLQRKETIDSYVSQKDVYVDSDGNVGIGTTTPNMKLVVAGDVNITGDLWVSGQNMTVPDYVFEEDYDLRPLGWVESYIKENKHLPNIPSKQETNQINIVKQSQGLLEKIEEIFLHLFSINKRITDLEEENKLLKQELCKEKEYSWCK